MKKAIIAVLFFMIMPALQANSLLHNMMGAPPLVSHKGMFVCYEGWHANIPDKKITKEELKYPFNIFFDFMYSFGPDGIEYKDLEGNALSQSAVEAACVRGERSSARSHVIGPTTFIKYDALFKNGDLHFVIHRNIEGFAIAKTFYGDNYEKRKYLSNNIRAYRGCPIYESHYDMAFNETRSGELLGTVHFEFKDNKCSLQVEEKWKDGQMKSIHFFKETESRKAWDEIFRKDLFIKSKYIPVYRVCMQEDHRANKTAAEKLIRGYVEDIKTGIDYGLVSREEMNARDRAGRKLANEIQGNGLYSDFSYQVIANEFRNAYEDGSILSFMSFEALKKVPNLCGRFNKEALDKTIEDTEGPY